MRGIIIKASVDQKEMPLIWKRTTSETGGAHRYPRGCEKPIIFNPQCFSFVTLVCLLQGKRKTLLASNILHLPGRSLVL